MTRRDGFAPHARLRALARAVAVALVGGLIAPSAHAEETASRTDQFTATLSRGATVRVENISGDVLASPGAAFSATVSISVKASTRARAQELLGRVRILQSTGAGDYTLTTRWPREAGRRAVAARYELTVPKGVDVILETVQGNVRVRGLDGEVSVQSVNGGVEVLGARGSVSANTVNGFVEVHAAALPDSAEVSLGTVNGTVSLNLPSQAAFDLTASTMNGSIVSTFDLPRSSEATLLPAEDSSTRRPKAIVKMGIGEDGERVVEITEIERELRGAEVEGAEREVVRELRRFAIVDPRRTYTGRVGRGGARVKLSSLNGRIAVLAAGTKVADAREVVSARRSFVVTIPNIAVRAPRVRVRPVVEVLPALEIPSVPRVVGVPRLPPDAPEERVVRGDVSGDFLSTSGGGSYRIGHVSGRVKVLTQWGEIRVASAGGSADLKTHGGDVVIGGVGGSLQVRTMAGSIEAGRVGGSASADTSGGDIRLGPVGGSVNARTFGGDVVVEAVAGSVDVETGGGDVRVRCVERLNRGIVSIRNSGGDVELTLPADFRAEVELIVLGADDPDERRIRSDFPQLAVTRHGASQRAVGVLNGGGTKVTIRTASGSIRLKKE